ncbi:MAG: hypothetical protein KGI50_05545 [Patescibacteria group bacterium]|nr:hypothetical protein [Patescibacteria group bacterium]
MNNTCLADIQSKLVKRGFALISKLSITSEDCEYHVSCAHAECNNLIMHKRKDTFIVHLVQHLNDIYTTTQEHYSLRIWYQIDNEHILRRQSQGEFDFDTGTYARLPIIGYNESVKDYPPGLLNHGGSSHYNRETNQVMKCVHFENWSKDILTSDLIVTAILGVYDEVEHMITDRFSEHFRRSIFMLPTYVFPECKPFWDKRFDWQYFRGLFK